MKLPIIGIDLGKTVFHLVGLNPRSEVVARKRRSRTQLLHFTANRQVELIGMEACRGLIFLGGHWRAGTQSTIDASAVCEAIRKDEQERLFRCRSHRRGSRMTNDAVRADQDR
jgi:hypothetical protein